MNYSTLMSRRNLLQVSAASAAMMLASRGGAQEVAAEDSASAALTSEPFSFETLTELAQAHAADAYVEPTPPEGFLGALDYDDYRLIRFNADRARWAESDAPFQVHAFHTGWLFGEPVKLFEVTRDGDSAAATPMIFSTDDFEYLNELADRVPAHAELPGVAGFRLNAPLNHPDRFDELVSFLGASYFRALGRDSRYGLSARGLALNTAGPVPEEFPRFTRFYLERDPQGAAQTVVYALLDSPSVSGAYRFVIRPGDTTEMDVTARLFFRADVGEMGIAPMTSMFLYNGINRTGFDDYRPRVHDSDGLRIVQRGGDVIWRPLNNPVRLAGSYFAEDGPVSFGLHQRERDFAKYQDAEAHYEMRPSLEVVPTSDWGPGHIRLVEIPTDLEVNDNIVAYFIPEGDVKAGDAREFSYRLRWGDLPESDTAELAHVVETRAGAGGVSGVVNAANKRKFVIDFKGGFLSRLSADDDVAPIVSVTGGELVNVTLGTVEGHDIWRMVLDVIAGEGGVVELSAHVAGYDRKLTETWLYQWIRNDA
ncbi:MULTISPECIES: glucan biosynthesis protein G [unclassified Yoonia]|uniref:glucan biosynthesis protein n=1 Tax=unclassified Yoonia TaxID=2629118 RepID=UPI002AFEB5DD|nr:MULTISPECIES: glucan biosynthesis protein G [unclassified Yoonia]